jgi:hypothetical protein
MGGSVMTDFVETEAEWKKWDELAQLYYSLGQSKDANECWAIADQIRERKDSDKATIIAKIWQARKIKDGSSNE